MSEETFTYTFSKDGPIRLNCDCKQDGSESLDVAIRGEEAHLFLDREGLLSLAKLMVKLAEGDFGHRGFTVHLSKDFAADDNIRLVLYRVPDSAPAGEKQ